MSEQTFWGVVGLFSLAIVAIAGALWKHVIEDGKVRERLATLEADSAQVKAEVKSIRQRLHDFFDGLKRGDWELIESRYQQFTVALAKVREEALGWVEALKVEIRALIRPRK